jgi:hypothetical protein
MEAAGAPRSDAERRKLVRRSTRGAGQRGLARRDKSGLLLARRCRRAGRGTKRAPLVAGFCTCALETLALWAFHPTRLETRTKESNMYASRWVANPRRRK